MKTCDDNYNCEKNNEYKLYMGRAVNNTVVFFFKFGTYFVNMLTRNEL